MPSQKPYKIRCPHKDCQKYMLIEATDIKDKIACLVCKKEFSVESLKQQKTQANTVLGRDKIKNDSEPATKGLSMIFCPRCESSYGLPPGATSALKKNCPRCGQAL